MTGLIVGSGWSSGINLYGVVALLNIYGRLGFGEVPEVLQRTDVLVIALILYALEFVADKVPYLDNIWDVVHTAIRPLGAAVLGWIMVGDASALNQFVATIGAGGLALVSHATKATTRVAVNTSPEPVSNSVVSLAEDGLVAFVVFLAVEYPIAAIAVVIVLLVIGVYVMYKLIGLARKGLLKIKSAFRSQQTT
jgi:hypothetical protein